MCLCFLKCLQLKVINTLKWHIWNVMFWIPSTVTIIKSIWDGHEPIQIDETDISQTNRIYIMKSRASHIKGKKPYSISGVEQMVIIEGKKIYLDSCFIFYTKMTSIQINRTQFMDTLVSSFTGKTVAISVSHHPLYSPANSVPLYSAFQTLIIWDKLSCFSPGAIPSLGP